MKIKISDITIDDAMQLRAAMSEPTVSEYEEMMAEAVEFPPVVIWHNENANILVDGYHRVEAAKRAGFVDITYREANALTFAQALFESATYNTSHGLRFNQADKRSAISKLIRASPDSSNTTIAAAMSVSPHTVCSVRESEGLETTRVKGKDGKSYPSKKMKKEPRPGAGKEDEDPDRDDNEKYAPPPDTGLGGNHLSPEELAKSETKRMTKSEAVDICDKAIHDLTDGGYEATVAALIRLKAWLK